MPDPRLDPNVIAESLGRLLPAGQVVELRALNWTSPEIMDTPSIISKG
jgi:hypothetical protein